MRTRAEAHLHLVQGPTGSRDSETEDIEDEAAGAAAVEIVGEAEGGAEDLEDLATISSRPVGAVMTTRDLRPCKVMRPCTTTLTTNGMETPKAVITAKLLATGTMAIHTQVTQARTTTTLTVNMKVRL